MKYLISLKEFRDNRNTGLSRRFVDFFPRCIENQVGQIRI